jgi:hypothetical protein
MTERMYALIRVSAGSYLLPSNDAQTLWHIYSFMDGESMGLTGQRDQKFWGCARFDGTPDEAIAAVERDVDEFGHIRHDSGYPSYRSSWREADTYLRTRRAAIEAALSARV